MIDVRLPFAQRVQGLPRLGLGLSTEFGAAARGLDLLALRRAHPELVQFLEVGADLERGLDADAQAWISAGWPLTYHFLDLNLEESESLCADWVDHTRERACAARAAWLCGDAGLWHVGPRDRGHGALLPPILTASSARAMADNVRRAREQTGFEVLPENPPAHLYLGELHILEYFARVAQDADCGLLLDVAHLALYQHAAGRRWSDGLADFALERVVEIHVAGATAFRHRGRRFIDDDHSPEPLPATWKILDYVLPRAPQLRALVYEGERNAAPVVLPRLRRLQRLLAGTAALPQAAQAQPERGRVQPRPAPVELRSDPAGPGEAPAARAAACAAARAPAGSVDHRRLQRALFRMQLDSGLAARIAAREADALGACALGPAEQALLAGLDLRALEADRGGRRMEQFLRNVAGEFPLSLAVLGPAVLADFPRSPEFHTAVSEDHPLPLALAAHLRRRVPASAPLARALLELETRLAAARRAPLRAPAPPPPAHVALAPAAELLRAPAGTHAAAEQLRAALDAGRALPKPALAAPAGSAAPPGLAAEWLLVCAAPAAAPFALRELRIEPLPEALAELLQCCREPQSRAGLRACTGVAEEDAADLDAAVASLCADGALLGALD